MQEGGLNQEQLRATGRLVEQASMGHQRPISSRLGPLAEATEVSLRAIRVSNAERSISVSCINPLRLHIIIQEEQHAGKLQLVLIL